MLYQARRALMHARARHYDEAIQVNRVELLAQLLVQGVAAHTKQNKIAST